MNTEEALKIVKLLKQNDLIEVNFNGGTGIARFICFDGKHITMDRWLDNPKRIRLNIKMLPQNLKNIANPDEARVKRAIKAFSPKNEPQN